MRVSVCIPVRPPEPYLAEAINALTLSYVGEILFDYEGSLRRARRRLAARAHCDLILNLDADTILPGGYLPAAKALFTEIRSLGAVALRYAEPYDHGHLVFGTSLIPREIMLEYYDHSGGAPCECRYMWNKLEALGFKVVTVKGMLATHKHRSG